MFRLRSLEQGIADLASYMTSKLQSGALVLKKLKKFNVICPLLSEVWLNSYHMDIAFVQLNEVKIPLREITKPYVESVMLVTVAHYTIRPRLRYIISHYCLGNTH